MGGHALPRASQKRGYTIRVHSCPFVSIRVHSCPFVSIRVHSCPFVSIRVHSCPFVSIRVHSCPFVSIRVHSCPFESFVAISVDSPPLARSRPPRADVPACTTSMFVGIVTEFGG